MSDGHAGRLALVTGGATGIGQAFARRLARDGARVAIIDLNQAREAEAQILATRGEARSYVCDVSDPQAVERMANAVGAQQGRVDILVNNAGIYPFHPWHEMTFEQWRRVQAVNLDSMFLTTKAFVPAMINAGWGRVINVTSGSGWIPSPRFSAYVTSKLGVVGYTRGLAMEVGGTGVTVNAIAPSLVRTETIEATEHARYLDEIAEAQAIKRVQEPDDLVGTLSFLASDDAAFITAQTFSVDGGYVRL